MIERALFGFRPTTKRNMGSKMLLSGQEILQRQKHDLLIEPFSEDRLNPNSYNLALHHEILVYEEVVLDAASPNRYRRIEIPDEGLTLQPNMLYLGRTVEYTETHGVVPMIQGRSSLGRLPSPAMSLNSVPPSKGTTNRPNAT